MDPDCHESAIENFALDTDESVRAAAASNPSSNAAILVRLATDGSPRVRGSVVRNPHVGLETLKSLVEDQDSDVAEEAQLRLDAMKEALVRWGTLQPGTSYSVVLVSRGARPMQVIRELRDLTGLGLAESLALSKNLTATLVEDVDRETANYFVQRLEGTGASAIVAPTPARQVL